MKLNIKSLEYHPDNENTLNALHRIVIYAFLSEKLELGVFVTEIHRTISIGDRLFEINKLYGSL